MKSSGGAGKEIRCPVWNRVDQFRAAVKEQDVWPARRSALERKSLIFDKKISWSNPMNRFSLEINRQQSAAAQDRNDNCAGYKRAKEVRCAGARTETADHKCSVILCSAQTFSRLKWAGGIQQRAKHGQCFLGPATNINNQP